MTLKRTVCIRRKRLHLLNITQFYRSLTRCIKYTLCKTMNICAILSAPFALNFTKKDTVHCTLYSVQYALCTLCTTIKTCASCKGYSTSQCAIERMSFAIQKLPYVGHNLPYKVRWAIHRAQFAIQSVLVP